MKIRLCIVFTYKIKKNSIVRNCIIKKKLSNFFKFNIFKNFFSRIVLHIFIAYRLYYILQISQVFFLKQ